MTQRKTDSKPIAITDFFKEPQNSSLVVIDEYSFTDIISFISDTVGEQKEKGVAIFSSSLSRGQLIQHLICSKADINDKKLKTDKMQSTDWTRLKNAINDLAESSLWIDYEPNINLTYLCDKCREQKQRYENLELVVIDNLQPLKAETNNLKSSSAAIKGLENLADELGVKIILGTQSASFSH